MTSKSPLLKRNRLASNINASCDFSLSLVEPPDSPEILGLPKPPVNSKQIHPMGFAPILCFDSKPEIEGNTDALEKVKRALMSEIKSKEEVLLLAKFLESTTFFNHFSAKCLNDLYLIDILLYLSQYASYERIQAGKAILQEDEKSEGKVYLILSGEVNVIVNKIEDFIKTAVATNIKSYEILALLLKRNFTKTINDDINLQEKSNKQDISPPKILLNESNDDDIYQNAEDDNDHDVENSLLLTLGQDTIVKSNEPLSPGLPQSLDNILEVVDSARILRNTKSSKIMSSLIPKPNTIQKMPGDHGKIVDKLQKGEYFGGSSPNLVNNIMTIISRTDCEFLTISEEVYLSALLRFERQNMRKLNFLTEFFPGIEAIRSKSLLYELFFQTQEKRFCMNAYITTQGSPGKTSFMLFEGVCNLYVKLPENTDYNEMRQYGNQEDQNKQDGILVCKLTPGTFIGEEILFNSDKNYEFTVKAASTDVTVILVNLNRMAHEFPATLMKDLKRMYLTKSQHYRTSASQRVKLKMAVFPLMKSPRLKKSRTNLLRKETPDCQSARVLDELSSSPPRETPVIDEKVSSVFRISKIFTREVENKYQSLSLRNQTPGKSHTNAATNAVKRKLLAQVSLKETNRSAQEQINSIKLRFGNEEKLSPLLRRSKEKSVITGDLGINREAKSVESKPKLNIQTTTPDLDKTKAITKDLMKKFHAGQSRASKRNWNNISISMVTDRSARNISPEETKGLDNERSVKMLGQDKKEGNVNNGNNSQVMKRSETNKSVVSYRSVESLQIEPASRVHSPQKQRKLVSRQKNSMNSMSSMIITENPVYNFTSRNLEKEDKEKNQMIKLKQVCLEAGYYAGIRSKNQLFINTDRKID